MTCQDMMDLMQRSLDLDLTVPEEQALFAHLNGCPGCADLYERLKLLSQELAQLPKVLPPYSIVDSIMPQLEGAGGFAEPGAAAETDSYRMEPVARELVAYRNKKKGLFSWKIVSGVAAAGILIGLFYSEGFPGQDRKTSSADGTFQGALERPADTAQAKPAAGISSSAPAVNNNGSSFQTFNNQVLQDSPSDLKKLADSKTNEGQTPAAAASPKPEGTVRTGKEVSSASQRSAQPGYGSGLAGQYGQLAGTGTAADSSVSNPSGDTAGMSGSPAVTDQMKAGSSDADPEKQLRPKDKAQSMLVNPGESTAPEASPAERSGVSPMVSPDGRFTASLDGDSVILTASDGTLWYRSGSRLETEDQITFNGWSRDGIFTYTIRKKDGTESVHEITAESKKESAT